MRRLLIATVLVTIAAPAAGRQAVSPPEGSRLQAELRDARLRARRLRADAAEARAELAALDRRLARLTGEAAAEDARLAEQRRRLDELNAREAALAARLSRERGAQGRLLSALQRLSRDPPPALLIPADQAVDTVRAAILIRAVSPEIERRAKALEAERAELARIRRLAVLSSEALLTRESEAGDRRSDIESLKARRTALLAILSAEAAEAESAARTLEARIRGLGLSPLPLDESGAEEAARLPGGRTRLVAPVSGAPDQRFSRGAPGWRWKGGQAASAPAAGTVAYAGPLDGWGQVVILDLGPGWRAVVAGLDSLDVDVGQRVAAGAPLGRAGRDGETYFELRRGDRPVDPGPWLD